MRRNQHIAPLDGLRGFAAIAVLASHTHIVGDTTGTMAVWFFFVLSAFLLTTPFATDADAYSPAKILAFIVRRLFRLLPLYVVFVVVFGLLSRNGSTYIYNNLVLFRGSGHLWTINQELVFYLALPFLAMAVWPLRRFPSAAAAILLVVAFAAGRVLTLDVLSINAIDGKMPFFLSPFLVGMALCFAYPAICRIFASVSTRYANVGSAALVAAVVLQALWLRAHSTPQDNAATLHPLPIALLLGITMVWIIATPRNLLKSFSGLPACRLLGQLGYGFYLFHWITVAFIPHDATIFWFSVFAVLTFGMAYLAHHLVEKPFITLGRNLTARLTKTATPAPAALQPQAG